jgi:hypothetical protein
MPDAASIRQPGYENPTMSENTDSKEADGLERPSTPADDVSLAAFADGDATLEDAVQLWVKLENPREVLADE